MASLTSTFAHPAAPLARGGAGIQPRPAARTGLIARLTDAARRSHQRRLERDIARFLQQNGARLTDSLEREIERRFGPMDR